ncbi:SDR family NAD(P)-dependent oxidoreductase [Sandaracinobacter sp. RS1-74]|uniref:SDR family NAD(P)-dependent oxidoreductase n=1 Tax=Sphingomonadales TaxID=204457 RepID=UPI0004C41B05|nr:MULTISPECIES: SDR family NAD(P)-dependent oxidoreductase [Sphingomonadales]MCG2839521.1 SDR family NAD(P)-dependent oxidoreductase [Sandaracinobacteroides sayramensis]
MMIAGQAAIVTGGASGLGHATARMLAEAGARVTILDMNAEAGQAAAAEIGASFVAANVADDASVAAALDAAEATHGPARILVNCAGIAPAMKTVGKEYVPHTLDLFRRTVEVNLIGSFNLIAKFAARAAALDAVEDERGVIVNTASVAAYDGQIGQAAYSASKGGVVGMTLPIARDLAPLKIRVMTIAPGIFLTPMVAAFPKHVQAALGAQVPHPSRLGQPSEYAQLIEAILTNPMLNGEVIRLDGAIRMATR